jgi:NAD(P)-dependent dehydrogenase (short-subunit alcohol dehydrogenase family)
LSDQVRGKLDGKVAIVTGAGQGGGRGSALNFAREGADVVLFGRTAGKLESVAQEIKKLRRRALVVAGDATQLASVNECVERTIASFGRLDILVNAAQSPDLRYGPLLQVKPEVMQEMWSSGPVATLAFMRACHPHLRAAGGGAIVNFGSGAQFSPKDYGPYAASKAAVQTLSRAAALEWASDGIRVNVIIPLAASPAYDAACAADPTFATAFTATIPLKRMGDPDGDIGRAVLFLAGPDAAYVTGTTLMVDGGHSYLR